jgi:putative intracellular protease/amidase
MLSGALIARGLAAALSLAPRAGRSVPAARPEPSTAARPLEVVFYEGPGLSRTGFAPALAAVAADPRLRARVVPAAAFAADGALDGADVVVFMGGSGSRQGRAIGPEGRAAVRRFVAAGGGYIGVCAGSYLALQGEPEFHKLAIAAGRNASGDAWKRGEAALRVDVSGHPDGDSAPLRLHFANGPVLARVAVPGLPPWVELAHWAEGRGLPQHGTAAAEMPGTPAIVATSYGAGRLLLWSPNPALGGDDAHPELFLAGIRWAATPGPVANELRWTDVFAGEPTPDRR